MRSTELIVTLAATQQGIWHKQGLPLCTIHLFFTFTFSPSVCRKLLWDVWLLRRAQHLASFLMMCHNNSVAMKPARATETKRKKNNRKERPAFLKRSHFERNDSLLMALLRLAESNKSTSPRSRAQIRGNDKWLNPVNEDGVALSTLFFHFITGCGFSFMAYSPFKCYSLSSLAIINLDCLTACLRHGCSQWSSR